MIKFDPPKPFIVVETIDYIDSEDCKGIQSFSVLYEFDKDFIDLLRKKTPSHILR